MPISVNDPRYLAEFVPPTIRALRAPLCNGYGVPVTHFGDKGNLVHASGYHRSEAWIRASPDSRYRDTDYSLKTGPSQDRNAISAFDFTPGSWGTSENRRRMVEITRRVYTAALNRDPRLRTLYEFAGTLNGTSVVTFYADGGGFKSPFDSSHLDHAHGSIRRSRQLDDHSGIAAVMLGQPQEADVPELTPLQGAQVNNSERYLQAIAGLLPTAVGISNTVTASDQPVPFVAAFNELCEDARAAAARPVDMTAEDRSAIVAGLVAALGPLLPTLEDIGAVVDAKVDERLNGATIRTVGH